MCNFFSFTMSFDGVAQYVDGVTRLDWITNPDKRPTYCHNPDSHSAINRLHGVDDDGTGKYEVVNGEFRIDLSIAEIDTMARAWAKGDGKAVIAAITENMTWYDNGKPFVHEHYVNGKLHGERRVWYDNGKPKVHAHYVNGVRQIIK